MSSFPCIPRPSALSPSAASAAQSGAAPQQHPPTARRKVERSGGALARVFTSSLGLLRGLARPAKPLHIQAWPATEVQRSRLSDELQKDLTRSATIKPHTSGMSRQFASDAVRSSIFLVPKGSHWRAEEDVHPADEGALSDTVEKLTDFCGGDKAWAFRVSLFANQNLGNSALLAGIIGGQILDGRSYHSRIIHRCETLQCDQISPEHNRLVLSRTGEHTLRVEWTQARDLTALHLAGRSKPKNLAGKGASYEVSLSLDIDRPQAGEVTPVRVNEAVLHSRLPRPLDG